MKLKEFEYSERLETGEEWQIDRLHFGDFNLIVGRNATGKTRLLESISRTAGILSGEARNLTRTAKFQLVTGDPRSDASSFSDERNATWARRAQYFPFTGKMNFKTEEPDGKLGRSSLVEALRHGQERFGQPFLEGLLRSMHGVGYPLEDIVVSDRLGPKLEVKEGKRPANTPFRRLSQGQQRALTLLTFINLLEARGESATVLVDDFAEGLDFEHARLFSEFLIARSSRFALQYILATNDRYVMNAVPLEHWSVLVEEGSRTRVHDYQNSKARFDDFKFTGLNNFDFFSMDFARPEA